MKTVREVCSFIAGFLPYQPFCIETGCMYVCPEGNEKHTTTNNIVDFICRPKDGTLVSFDLDENHIEFARKFCGKNNIKFVNGDSVEEIRVFLSEVPTVKIDLVCFDSKEFDDNHMVNEFTALSANLSEDHYILVDDIHNANSVKHRKLVPMLKDLGYDSIEIPTPTGLFVGSKSLPLPSLI